MTELFTPLPPISDFAGPKEALPPDAEALFREARQHRRRRRLVAVGTALLACALGGGLFAVIGSTGGRTPGAPIRAATSADLSAFNSRAKRGLKGSYIATYRITLGSGRMQAGLHRPEPISVVAAQLSPRRYSYQYSPWPQSPNRAGSREKTFVGPGLYNCTKAAKQAPWICNNYSLYTNGANMFYTNYPPQGLVGNLQNAECPYTMPGCSPKPLPGHLYLVEESLGGQDLSCLDFGSVAKPFGFVCLDSHDLIARYALPMQTAGNAYVSATLLSYSRTVPRSWLRTPAPLQPELR